MQAPEPIFIGYFVKRIASPSEPALPSGVVQICNAGHCGGFAPDGWMDAWRHNELGLFDSEELAWSVVPEGDRSSFEIHAYRMFPTRFVNGEPQPIQLPLMEADPLPPDSELLTRGNWLNRPVRAPGLQSHGRRVGRVP